MKLIKTFLSLLAAGSCLFASVAKAQPSDEYLQNMQLISEYAESSEPEEPHRLYIPPVKEVKSRTIRVVAPKKVERDVSAAQKAEAYEMVRQLVRRGDYKDAVALLEKIGKHFKDPDAYRRIAIIHKNGFGRYEVSYAEYEKWLKKAKELKENSEMGL